MSNYRWSTWRVHEQGSGSHLAARTGKRILCSRKFSDKNGKKNLGYTETQCLSGVVALFITAS